jgi:hypothetical protein
MQATFTITEKDGKVMATMQLDEAATALSKECGAKGIIAPPKHAVLLAAQMVIKTLEDFGKGLVDAGSGVDVTEAERKKHDSSPFSSDITLE